MYHTFFIHSFCIAQGAELRALWHLEGWDGEEGGREAQVGGDICIHIAASQCCTAETNMTW